MEKSATLFRPKLIVAGASAYARHYDYARMRAVSFLIHLTDVLTQQDHYTLSSTVQIDCKCCIIH